MIETTLQPIKTEWRYEWSFGECQTATLLVTGAITVTIVLKLCVFLFAKKKQKVVKSDKSE